MGDQAILLVRFDSDKIAAKLFGGTSVKLADLQLGGSFVLSPVGAIAGNGLVSETTSQLTANLSGTLASPQRSLDIGTMVDAIKMQAYDLELARLEKLKADDDARVKAAAEAYAAQQAAAKQAAEDAAAQKAADDAAAKKAAADKAAADKAAADKAAADAAARRAAQQNSTAPSNDNSPMDLGMPPLQPSFQ